MNLQYWEGVKEALEYVDEELGLEILDCNLYEQALSEIESITGRKL